MLLGAATVDVLYFLKQRTRVIRYFHETASLPFNEIKRKIEDVEAPFDNPPYDESGEPAYLNEWLDADLGLELVGRSCVSMLSASLQLYFKTWERELHVKWAPGEKKAAFKNGFVQGYRDCFGEVLKIDWRDCPIDFAILEQVVLARNRDQHPEDIVLDFIQHSASDREKYPIPFFISDSEKALLEMNEESLSSIVSTIRVSGGSLLKAIREVEMLGEWLEERMFAVKYP